MGPVTFFLGMGCGLALLLTMVPPRGRRRHDADDRIAGLVIGYAWFLGVILEVGTGRITREISPEWPRYLSAAVDMLTGMMMVRLYRRRPAVWKRVFVLMVGSQLLAHVGYGLSDKPHVIRYAYALWLNVSTVAELLCVASRGAGDGLRLVRGGLFSRPLRLRQHGAGNR